MLNGAQAGALVLDKLALLVLSTNRFQYIPFQYIPRVLAVLPTMVWIMSGVHVQAHTPWWCPGVARSWGGTKNTARVDAHAHAAHAAHVQLQGHTKAHAAHAHDASTRARKSTRSTRA